jgi:hypothetical protein
MIDFISKGTWYNAMQLIPDSCSWVLGPPVKHDKFLVGILLTLNLELFRTEKIKAPAPVLEPPH